MKALEPQAAAAGVIGLAVFQLVEAWNAHSPSLQDLRAAPPGSSLERNQLLDTNILVGGLAVVVGVGMAVLTHDMTALVLLMVTFGLLSVWHYQVLAAPGKREIG